MTRLCPQSEDLEVSEPSAATSDFYISVHNINLFINGNVRICLSRLISYGLIPQDGEAYVLHSQPTFIFFFFRILGLKLI